LGQIALCLVSGYVVGSFPTAYILVRWKSRIDIRNAGSGNVGTLNSFLVTGSHFVGIAVLLIDCLKGTGAVLLGYLLADGQMLHAVLSGAGAVAGHNYPVWLHFRGGKGLATAAGAMAVICWPVIPLWMVLWSVAYAIMRSIDPANVVASGLILLGATFFPEHVGVPFVPVTLDGMLRGFVAVVMTIILSRHIAPLMESVRNRKRSREVKQQ
jgi:acyl phosphate:glycerol-3-phosphate acyltransferase